jgi:hypothetical protein
MVCFPVAEKTEVFSSWFTHQLEKDIRPDRPAAWPGAAELACFRPDGAEQCHQVARGVVWLEQLALRVVKRRIAKGVVR